ncbi:MAG: hypothetical protein JJE19_02795, partial [Methanosarcinales archaeon]|nr:hypothetical protein [Methanosarcinales archaeon]
MAWVKTAGTPGTPGYKRSVSGEAAMSPSQAESRGYHWEPQKKSLGRRSGEEAPTKKQYEEMISIKKKRGDYPQLSRVGVRGPLKPEELSFFSKLEQFGLKYPRLGPLVTSLATVTGLSASEQQKIAQKELEDIQRLEKQYIESGELRPTHEVIQPSDIGEIKGVYKETGFLKPSPRLDYGFTGTEARYQALTKEYDEYTRAREKHEELRGVSIVGRYERAEEKTGEFIAARTPEWEKLPVISQYQRYKAWQESLIGEQMKEMGGMKTTGQILESEFLKPIYMGIREKPVKTAVTTAAFFALGPVLKGAGYAFKPVAKVGVKAFPRATPWIGKWTPRAVGVGLGTAYAADVGRRVYAAPPKMRMEELSKITGTELLPMGLGTYAGLKAWPKIGGFAATIGKPTIPIKQIGVQRGYPIRKGLTEAQLRESFRKATLEVKPSEYRGSGREVMPYEPYPKRAVLPGEVPEGVYAWRGAAYLESAKMRLAVRGTSGIKGEYYAPVYEAYFSKIPKGGSGYVPFGWDMPRISIPSAVRTHAIGLGSVPKAVRARGTAAISEWLYTQRGTGKFFMPKTKPEYEAILPLETELRLTRAEYRTRIGLQRIPIYEYEVVPSTAAGKGITTEGALAAKYDAYYYRPKPLVTPYHLSAAYVARYGRYAPGKYKYPSYKEPPYKQPPYKEPPYKEPPYKEPPYKEPPYKEPPYKE